MAGSNIFIMYTSANGQNVTVSPRQGVGEVEPEHDGSDSAQITLLEGSGVSNGKMIANVRCHNCNSWNGGTMDFRSSNAKWIYAAKRGSPLDSDDLGEELSQHDINDDFTWDFSTAKGGNDVNPFVAAASSSTPSTPDGPNATNTPNTSNTTTTTTTNIGYSVPSNIKQIMMAHGILASLAFVVLFPVGGMLIRLATFSGFVRVHVCIQLLAYAIFLAAFGLGAYMSNLFSLTSRRHPIIGIIVLVLIFFQPIFGYIHHRLFKLDGRRNVWSIVHITIGRVAIILGIINGGLGLDLAGNASRGALIAYGVVGGLFGIAYLVAAAFGEVQLAKRGKAEARQSVVNEKSQREEMAVKQGV